MAEYGTIESITINGREIPVSKVLSNWSPKPESGAYRAIFLGKQDFEFTIPIEQADYWKWRALASGVRVHRKRRVTKKRIHRWEREMRKSLKSASDSHDFYGCRALFGRLFGRWS